MKKLIVLFFSILMVYYIYDEHQSRIKIQKYNELTADIQKHYSPHVKTSKQTNLYNHDLEVVGEIGENQILSLAALQSADAIYFETEDKRFKVYYQDVLPTNETLVPLNPNLIPFNLNILTKSGTNLYTNEGKLAFYLKESLQFQIMVDKEDKYGIYYEGQLLYINKGDDYDILISENQMQEIASRVPVLMYHFFYDKDKTRPHDGYWLEVDTFEAHLQYLQENNYVTLTMLEFEQFLHKEINVPKNSVVLTIDDGDPSVSELAYPLIEKYNVNATVFVITGGFENIDFLRQNFIDLQSHSHQMHNKSCDGGLSATILCIDHESGMKDLASSANLLNGSFVFSYPYGQANEHAVELLKSAGFRMAFTTELGSVIPGMNPFYLPRQWVFTNTNIAQFIKLLN